MKVLFKFMKKAEKNKNRIIIPKFIIQNYGRDYIMKVFEDGSMTLIPIKNKEQ